MSRTNTTANQQLPNRPLRSDFTAITLKNARRANNRYQRWHGFRTWFSTPQKQEKKFMNLLHKPLFASLVAVAVIGIGGTTYAAVNGGLGSITALFGGSTKLTDSRVVKVAVQNCHDVNPFNVAKGTGDGNEDRYYQVKDSAKMSDQQVVSLVQSICRSVYSPEGEAKLYDQVAARPENKDALIGNANGTITAVSDSSIDIKIPGGGEFNTPSFTQHFSRLDPNLLITNGTGVAQPLSVLKVGQTVGSQYRNDGPPYPTEATHFDKIDWSTQTLVVISVLNTDQKAYDQYQNLIVTKKIEQVTPCKTNDTGYCTFEQAHS